MAVNDRSAEELRAALETALRQRDELKRAGDAIVELVSHPSRNPTPMLEAVVEFRRVSDEIAAEETADAE